MEKENPWKITGENEVYDNPWIRLTEYGVINPSGGPGIYGKVHFKNLAIGILPLDDEENTYLVGQFRFTLNAYSWEIPEGGGPIGIPALDSAKRELKEETGLEAASWQEIQTLHLSNSVSDEISHIFLARKLTEGVAMPEETERITVWKLPFIEAVQLVLNGKITDAMSVAAILKVQFMKQNGRL